MLPILTPMTRRIIHQFDCGTSTPRRSRRAALRWLGVAGRVGILGSLWLGANAVEAQDVRSEGSTIAAPAPDEQPASPWSRPFRVSIPASQPPRHVETQTQKDSSSAPTTVNHVSEVVGLPEYPGNRGPKAQLASQISREVLHPKLAPSSQGIEAIEPPMGWSSIETSLRASVEKCDHLLRRGAVHSARQETLSGLRLLVRNLDLHHKQFLSEPMLQQGLTALREAEDFERYSITELASVQRTVRQHQTPVLQERSLEDVSPAVAAQHYRAYARDALATAADEHPWGADLIYALGKTYERESQLEPDRQLVLLQHANACFQAAHEVAPTRHRIANQLGYNMLQLGRNDQAIDVLERSIAQQPSASAWRNLAEAYRRRGDHTAMQDALREADLLATAEPVYTPERPQITELAPEDFAKISPPPASTEPLRSAEVPRSAAAPQRSRFPKIWK